MGDVPTLALYSRRYTPRAHRPRVRATTPLQRELPIPADILPSTRVSVCIRFFCDAVRQSRSPLAAPVLHTVLYCISHLCGARIRPRAGRACPSSFPFAHACDSPPRDDITTRLAACSHQIHDTRNSEIGEPRAATSRHCSRARRHSRWPAPFFARSDRLSVEDICLSGQGRRLSCAGPVYRRSC